MPRPRKPATPPTYSHGQAHYVLHRLIDERRLSHGEVSRYVGEMHSEISSLEKRLASLKAAAGTQGAAASGGQTGGARRGRPPGSGRRAAAPAAATAAAPAAAPVRRRRRRGPGRPPGSGALRKKSVLSPQQLASRQLQGRYLGLIRQIPANKRAPYQKTAKEKGREAAIREMQDTLKK
jgi:hypothetical protein